MTNEEILEKAKKLVQGHEGFGPVLGIEVKMVRQLAFLARGLQAAGRREDACVFLDGLLALYPEDPELLRIGAMVRSRRCQLTVIPDEGRWGRMTGANRVLDRLENPELYQIFRCGHSDSGTATGIDSDSENGISRPDNCQKIFGVMPR